MIVLCRNGHPFLFLPACGPGARAVLKLYSPQSLKARVSKRLLEFWLSGPWSRLSRTDAFPLSPDAPLWKFIGSFAPGSMTAPLFGLLAGNPNTPGQRFIVLVLDSNRRPFLVLKVGLTVEARRLIDREYLFLKAQSDKFPGLPKIVSNLKEEPVRALALEYIFGKPPRKEDLKGLAGLLKSWLSFRERVRLADVPIWKNLSALTAFKEDRSFPEALGNREVAVTLYHGDLAPWNIRVNTNHEWIALDWERGETIGVPGWDWFHFHLQTHILAKGSPVSAIVEDLEKILLDPEFREYAKQTGIAGMEKPLVTAYLWHMVHIIRPAEGMKRLQDLDGALRERWNLALRDP